MTEREADKMTPKVSVQCTPRAGKRGLAKNFYQKYLLSRLEEKYF